MPSNKNLAEMIRHLRGADSYMKFARRTGVNRQTLTELEQGVSVRIETLRRVAVACKLGEVEWTDMLIAWTRCAMGEKEFFKLDVRPVPTLGATKSLKAADELFVRLFHRLGSAEKADILKAMMRREVRDCLKASNQLWERGSNLDQVLEHEMPQWCEDVAEEIARLEVAQPAVTQKRRTS